MKDSCCPFLEHISISLFDLLERLYHSVYISEVTFDGQIACKVLCACTDCLPSSLHTCTYPHTHFMHICGAFMLKASAPQVSLFCTIIARPIFLVSKMTFEVP